ncbi:hypothetical protein KKI24_19975 [bacterium]|nr:hypothetical protein [bacterium]
MIIDLRLANRNRHIREFRELADEARALAWPKALYLEQEPTIIADKIVRIAGETFESQVLQINLAQSDKVFPALATCGRELDEWRASKTNILHQFWAKSITDSALEAAVTDFKRKIKKEHKIKFVSIMTPGSLMDWPLPQQEPLFRLFGDGAQRIGVTLNESFLMSPESTISCLAFSSETHFYTCQLCSNFDCRRRQADFDKSLLKTKYRLVTTGPQIGSGYQA